MEVKWFVLVPAIMLAGCDQPTVSEEVASELQCTIDSRVREYSPTFAGVIADNERVGEYLSGNENLERGIAQLSVLACDEREAVGVRFRALDIMHELTAINRALKAGDPNRAVSWQSEFSGSYGAVSVRADGDCMVVEFPSYLSLEGRSFVVSATERFCPDPEGQWYSVELIDMQAEEVSGNTI